VTLPASPSSSIFRSLGRTTCSGRGEGARNLVPMTVGAEESDAEVPLISSIMLHCFLPIFYRLARIEKASNPLAGVTPTLWPQHCRHT